MIVTTYSLGDEGCYNRYPALKWGRLLAVASRTTANSSPPRPVRGSISGTPAPGQGRASARAPPPFHSQRAGLACESAELLPRFPCRPTGTEGPFCFLKERERERESILLLLLFVFPVCWTTLFHTASVGAVCVHAVNVKLCSSYRWEVAAARGKRERLAAPAADDCGGRMMAGG